MQQKDAPNLFSKYQSGQCTPEERAIVENWLAFGEATPFNLTDIELAGDLEDIRLKLPMFNETKKRRLWPLIAAASVLLVLSGSLFLYFNNNTPSGASNLALSAAQDIAPGGDKATLTLADGSTINLSDASNGTLAKQNGINIVKTATGELIYETSNTTASAIATNIISTPRGGQYQVVLPDGSRVWLNAASSLKYPSSFKGLSNRKVVLSGEAYFEISKDKAHAFIVESDNQTVEVTGTHFNINSYATSAATKTTLLEGSVKVARSGTDTFQLLKPGQQSQISKENIKIVNVEDDTDIAWKNGYFKFTDNRIEEIMAQISRWYDVDVAYEGKVSNDLYSGRISRFKNISQVLKMIESAQSVHFKIEGRRITVIP